MDNSNNCIFCFHRCISYWNRIIIFLMKINSNNITNQINSVISGKDIKMVSRSFSHPSWDLYVKSWIQEILWGTREPKVNLASSWKLEILEPWPQIGKWPFFPIITTKTKQPAGIQVSTQCRHPKLHGFQAYDASD